MTTVTMPTAAEYARIFATEREQVYPAVDALETRLGYAIDRDRLEQAARVLACPLKANPPNWQHGRVIYTVTRSVLEGRQGEVMTLLDVGTAKGFSALCLHWAKSDANCYGIVTSVDVIDPTERCPRNTIAEVDGLKTLHEILEPWPEAKHIRFAKCTGRDWLVRNKTRVHVAFVDGKHSYEAVSWEATLLAQRQAIGDVILFDDLQVEGVSSAVAELRGYDVEHVDVLPKRRYAIARKR